MGCLPHGPRGLRCGLVYTNTTTPAPVDAATDACTAVASGLAPALQAAGLKQVGAKERYPRRRAHTLAVRWQLTSCLPATHSMHPNPAPPAHVMCVRCTQVKVTGHKLVSGVRTMPKFHASGETLLMSCLRAGLRSPRVLRNLYASVCARERARLCSSPHHARPHVAGVCCTGAGWVCNFFNSGNKRKASACRRKSCGAADFFCWALWWAWWWLG